MMILENSEDRQTALSKRTPLLRTIIHLSADYYWEQDQEHRFTLVRHKDNAGVIIPPGHFLGKTSWELGGVPVDGSDGWESHKTLRAERKPFANFLVRQHVPECGICYLSISGEPVFDDQGEFAGYQGITRDVTDEKFEERMLRLEHAVTLILLDESDTRTGLCMIIQAICQSEGWDAGQILSRQMGHQADSQHLQYQTGWSTGRVGNKRAPQPHIKPLWQSSARLTDAVIKSGQPLWTDDLDGPEQASQSGVDTGWNSACLIPLLSGEDVLGVLELRGSALGEIGSRELQMMHNLGRRIGKFLQRERDLERLRESEERHQSTVELAAIGISHVSNEGRFIHVNRQLCEMLGYSREELLGMTVQEISHPEDTHLTDEATARLKLGHIKSFKMDKRYLHKNGQTVWVRLTIARKHNEDGRLLYNISVIEDISERKEAEEQVQYMATHDDLTGLPNRVLFSEMLSHCLKTAQRYQRQFAVMFIDLDRFKHINDSLGHEAGDMLLQEMANRFQACLRSSDVVARVGGDEFVVLIQEANDQEEIARVARSLLTVAIKPMEIMEQECRVTASIGIALYSPEAPDEKALMKNADLAMYHAKEEGKNNYQFYSPDMSNQSIERLTLEAKLRQAMEHGEFVLHYQAIVNFKSGQIKGVEALLRWNNPELGTVSPVQFIPVAEETGLIVPLGKWVLQSACAQNVAWQCQGLPPVCISVNLSPRQFRDPQLVPYIRKVLEDSGLQPHLLELEITESTVMHSMEEAISKLVAIKELGVKIAIDDFGTGYSSLSQLKRFPIDTLKVDRSFIREIPNNVEDSAIAEAIIAMGKKLGLTVIAEGVETLEQQNFLRGHACDEMQGFYFSRPATPEDFAQLLGSQVETAAL